MMKIIVLILIVATAAVNARITDYLSVDSATLTKLKGFEKTCREQFNLDNSELNQYEENGFDNVSPATKCYYNCFAQATGAMKSNGKIDYKIVKSLTTEDEYPVAEKCIAKKGIDVCDHTYQMYKCFVDFKKKRL